MTRQVMRDSDQLVYLNIIQYVNSGFESWLVGKWLG
jgi:hypothetical protein